MTDLKRWRGLRALVSDAVDHGASAVQRVHLATARRPFALLAHVPGLRAPVQAVHAVHDGVVSGVYDAIRVTNHVVGTTLDGVLELLDTGDAHERQS
jgi:hypothetical protein